MFGELTWHFMPHGRITGGVRHFIVVIRRCAVVSGFHIPDILVPPTPYTCRLRQGPSARSMLPMNTTDHQYVYALWSQGFRRGGANTRSPSSGIFQESPLLLATINRMRRITMRPGSKGA